MTGTKGESGYGDVNEKEFNDGEIRKVPLIQLGIGTVGRKLVEKVREWNDQNNLEPRYQYIGLADKSGFAVNKAGFSEKELGEILKVKRNGGELAEIYGVELEDIGFLEQLIKREKTGILVDVTDADKFEVYYGIALERGWSVALANKIPLAGVEPEEFRRFKNSRLRYEATVGAGLPVISTLDHLKRHGEKFKEIAAILSGSLSFILSRAEEGVDLKEAVLEAKEKGFTEPNPAEDLLGNDVARKAVILGRTLGLSLSLDDIELEPLVELAEGISPNELENELEAASADFRQRVESAKSAGNRLRYVARITGNVVTVGLEEVSREGPLAQGNSTANVVLFRTGNYDEPPLIIQGPGAGPEVTAGGVFSDMKCLESRMSSSG